MSIRPYFVQGASMSGQSDAVPCALGSHIMSSAPAEAAAHPGLPRDWDGDMFTPLMFFWPYLDDAEAADTPAGGK